MTIREDRTITVPPAKALAGLCTAGENLGYTVQDVRPEQGLLLMSSPVSIAGFSFGYIATGRIQKTPSGSELSVDITPRFGSWTIGKSREEIDKVMNEFLSVLEAPRARIRAPEKKRPGPRPFGFVPEAFAAAWGIASVAVYGLMVGGWGWVPAIAGLLGAVLVFQPRVDGWWNWLVIAFSLLSLPFGAFGLVARRLSLATQYWSELIAQTPDVQWEPF